MIKKQNKVSKGELVFTSFLLALPIVVLWDAVNLVEVGITVIVGPKVVAIGIGIFLLALVLIQIVAVLKGNRGEPESIEGGELATSNNYKGLAIVVGAILFHIFTIEIIGFILATVPMFVAVAYALGERRWIRSLIVATVLVVGTFFGFTEGLELELPIGFEFLTDTVVDQDGVVVEDDQDGVVEDEEESW